MRYLKQSTASQTRTIGPFVDDTDFKTAETALSIANTDVRLKKNGADDVAKNSGGATHDVNGCYHLTFDATDTDTVGELFYTVKVAGALQVFGCFTVLEEAIYDALFATSANVFTGAAGSSKVTGVVLTDTLTTYTGNTVQTGDSYAIVNSGTHGNAAIKGYVDDIGAAGAGLTAVPWNAAWDAEVQSEVEDAIVVHRLDELLNADSDIDGASPPTVGSVFHELMTKTTGSFTFDQTTDSLEAIRDRGDAAWITATGFSTHTAADVWSVATRVLTAATNITSTGGTTVPQTGDSFARIGAAGASLTDLGGMSTTMKAQVNAEALDVLATDTLIDGKTIVAAVQYVSASVAGRVSGAGTGTEVFKGLDESTTRLTITVDSSGNRTDVTYG